MFILQILPVQLPAILVIVLGNLSSPLFRRQKAVFTPLGKQKLRFRNIISCSRRLPRPLQTGGNFFESGDRLVDILARRIRAKRNP
jgi:hypothetical protein